MACSAWPPRELWVAAAAGVTTVDALVPVPAPPPLAAAAVETGAELLVGGVTVGRAEVVTLTDQEQTELTVITNEPGWP
jgi:hypothetical protein